MKTATFLKPIAAYASDGKLAELARLHAERTTAPVERRAVSERRVTRDRRGAVRVIDTDGFLVVRPADPQSSAWMPI